MSIELSDNHVAFTRQLDQQRSHKKGIYGDGYLVHPKTAAYIDENMADMNTMSWELSEREQKLVKELTPYKP